MRFDRSRTTEPAAAQGAAAATLRGYTLVEIVMTLLIVSVLAVFAVTRLDFTSAFDERSLHDKLKGGLQFARKAAVASRRHVCVTVANGIGGKATFRIESALPENTTGSCDSDLNLPAPDRTAGCAANQICAGGLSLAADNASFRFDAQGRLVAAGTVSFSTPGQPGIVVEADTGYVH